MLRAGPGRKAEGGGRVDGGERGGGGCQTVPATCPQRGTNTKKRSNPLECRPSPPACNRAMTHDFPRGDGP